ncbi:MAG: KDO2-lipid IV(A) lauroyltransferase [Paracoccaceae bacterium]|jgi:KDO2-lipid IV(A) lauroyltransferase
MSRTQSPTISHRLEYLIYRVFEQSLKRMSLETTFKLGEFVGRVAFRLIKSRRKQVIRNLTYAFGDEKSLKEIAVLAAEVFERSGANFLSSMRIPFLGDKEIMKHLSFVGLHDLIREKKNGGLILVSPHMGNWELLAQAVFLTGSQIEVGTHYRPLNNSLINTVIERRRKKRGLQLFPKQTSTHRLINFVREGGALGVLADQRVGSRGTSCTFFGRPTTCSPLPHLIAKRGKGELMGLVCETVGPCQWEVRLRHIPIASAQACSDSLETAWRRSPADVFWFEDRWRIQGKAPLKFLDKYSDPSQVTRPLRLVNLAKGESSLPHPNWLLTQEIAELDFSLSDKELVQALDKISNQGSVPPDIFVCPERHKTRLKKLSRKTQILSV